mmetsp:Transcript_74632/g.117654  ORF Transcript_74632/g.117654 Transcript_74632/m.117654 type:complete len:720 (-) Transcript_74632:223-2382(-)
MRFRCWPRQGVIHVCGRADSQTAAASATRRNFRLACVRPSSIVCLIVASSMCWRVDSSQDRDIQKDFLGNYDSSRRLCEWRCQQNGANCDPGAPTCDCIAQSCSSNVAYSKSTDQSEEGGSLFIIPVVALGLAMVCCFAVCSFKRMWYPKASFAAWCEKCLEICCPCLASLFIRPGGNNDDRVGYCGKDPSGFDFTGGRLPAGFHDDDGRTPRTVLPHGDGYCMHQHCLKCARAREYAKQKEEHAAQQIEVKAQIELKRAKSMEKIGKLLRGAGMRIRRSLRRPSTTKNTTEIGDSSEAREPKPQESQSGSPKGGNIPPDVQKARSGSPKSNTSPNSPRSKQTSPTGSPKQSPRIGRNDASNSKRSPRIGHSDSSTIDPEQFKNPMSPTGDNSRMSLAIDHIDSSNSRMTIDPEQFKNPMSPTGASAPKLLAELILEQSVDPSIAMSKSPASPRGGENSSRAFGADRGLEPKPDSEQNPRPSSPRSKSPKGSKSPRSPRKRAQDSGVPLRTTSNDSSLPITRSISHTSAPGIDVANHREPVPKAPLRSESLLTDGGDCDVADLFAPRKAPSEMKIKVVRQPSLSDVSTAVESTAPKIPSTPQRYRSPRSPRIPRSPQAAGLSPRMGRMRSTGTGSLQLTKENSKMSTGSRSSQPTIVSSKLSIPSNPSVKSLRGTPTPKDAAKDAAMELDLSALGEKNLKAALNFLDFQSDIPRVGVRS